MFRHELKYIINPGSAHIIKSRMYHICGINKNAFPDGQYRVSSLYFDDYCNSVVSDNLS